tara:strand:- start:705 stop:881 length:177 start_codon:yes stop_codon:yes gene_type:complete
MKYYIVVIISFPAILTGYMSGTVPVEGIYVGRQIAREYYLEYMKNTKFNYEGESNGFF